MIIGVPKEIVPGERRVALVPDAVKTLKGLGVDVLIEAGAGTSAGFEDEAYREAEAELVATADEVFAKADLILKVQPPEDGSRGKDEVAALREGTALICHLKPLDRFDLAEKLAKAGVNAFSVEMMPRITRAQSMDVLSSQSTIAGYHAVLLASVALPRVFPMMVTAAGTLQPAKVLVIGAGVAGLQALGTAKRLGAITSSYDTRAAVKEQVQSIGAKFVELDLDTGDSEDSGGYAKAQTEEFYDRQRAELAKFVGASDIVITTALVPGQPAPFLITKEAVAAMKPGSVIVDLAAEKGGNCELTVADQNTLVHGVTIIGNTNLPSEVPAHASQMYAKNLTTFLEHLLKEGELVIDREDEITSGTLVSTEGKVVNEMMLSRMESKG